MGSIETALRSQYIPHARRAAAGRGRPPAPRTNMERGLTANLGDPAWHAPEATTEKKKGRQKQRLPEMVAKPAGIKALLNVSAIFSRARP